ncbi:CHASE3 domain-containing protein [Mesorhizobium sp. ASY16-5R]|uniref:CHASE3 domain-containing protein n=1 Tax=Mesorhizobium sp. ASY16-5R TaxID=3445772 RepID=UPI003FA01C98
MIARLRKALRAQLVPLVAGFAVLAAVVAARSVLIERQRQDNAAVLRTFEFERHIVTVLSLMQDAETSQRGYLLTGERPYLDPYAVALASLPKELDSVRTAAASSKARSEQVEALNSAIRDKLTEMSETLAFYDRRNATSAMEIVRSDRGKLAMDRVRSIIADIRRDENALLQRRLGNAERLDDWMRLVSILALVGVFAMAAFGILTARRRLEDLVSAHTQVTETNARLEKEIATRQAAEAQIRQMQKMEAIGQLTGGIAHDFNNMLAVIMSAMNLAQRKLKRGETDIEKFVEAATDAASRAANLTARLLAFSRQQPLAPQVIDANRLLTGMSDMLRRTLGEPIHIETVLGGGLWRTFADTSQLENAILNLAVNARDAMPEGGRLTIETANCHLDERYSEQHAEVPTGQYVLVAVTDTGTGMPPEVAERAFDPFFTTKEVSKGTGLGLSQVFGFVKQSGGHVKIYSEPGEGTTIKIYLPRYFGEQQLAEQPKTPAMVKQPTELVLVVEDDERVRVGTVAALRDLGYTVIHAGGADQALALLADNPGIALLFTDVIMPGTNGRKLAELARQTRSDLKVLFTTGFTKNAVVHNGVLDHGVDFIAKPFTIDELAVKMREVLDR